MVHKLQLALREENEITVDTYLEWRNSKKPKIGGPAEEDYSFLAEDDDIDCAPAAPKPAETATTAAESSTAGGGSSTANGGSSAGANGASTSA